MDGWIKNMGVMYNLFYNDVNDSSFFFFSLCTYSNAAEYEFAA
jgi:hypothetical protein